METTEHSIPALFAQLGLANDEASIQAFIRAHSPLADTVALHSAPFWTQADGLIYKVGDVKLSLIDKLVGQQYVGKQTLNATLTPFYRLPAYNNMDFKAGWTMGTFDLNFGIYNVLNERNLLAITVNDKTLTGGANVFDLANRGASLDQYFYAPSRSFQITLGAHF